MSDLIHTLMMAAGEPLGPGEPEPDPPGIVEDRDVLAFDGINDRIEIPGIAATAASTVAVDLWIAGTLPSGWEFGIVYHEGRTGLAIEVAPGSGNAIDIYAYASDASWGTHFMSGVVASLDREEWVRVVITRENGGSWAFYIDGTLEASGDVDEDMENNGQNGGIGAGNFAIANANAYDQFFPGRIANVRRWNRVLTAAEVADIDNETDGLTHFWPLDEGTGSTAGNDGSATGMDGTIIGATWVYVP